MVLKPARIERAGPSSMALIEGTREVQLAAAALSVLSILAASWLLLRRRDAPHPRIGWRDPPEAQPRWDGLVLPRPSLHALEANRQLITNYDPATGKELSVIPSLSAAEVSIDVDRAQAASVVWRRSTFETCVDTLRGFD